MILVAGASGRLGGQIARKVLVDGKQVRVLSRTRAHMAELKALGAEVVIGDLRDQASLHSACQGVSQVITTAHGSDSTGSNAPQVVDGPGNRHLIDAAKAAGVRRFLFISTHSARPDSPVDVFRLKYQTEQYLQASGIEYTILRLTHLMDTWVPLIGDPIVAKGQASIFGHGERPVAFVAASDVARLAALAVEHPEARNRIMAVGGPEEMTLRQMVALFERILARNVRVQSVPIPVLRLAHTVLRPINPVLSRQIAMAILLDTSDQSCDTTETFASFPIERTRLEEFIRARYLSEAQRLVHP